VRAAAREWQGTGRGHLYQGGNVHQIGETHQVERATVAVPDQHPLDSVLLHDTSKIAVQGLLAKTAVESLARRQHGKPVAVALDPGLPGGKAIGRGTVTEMVLQLDHIASGQR